MRVLWTEQSYARLAAILDYVAHDNPKAAERLVESLLAKGESLRRSPRRGRMVPELRDADIRELVHHNYRLIYRVRADTIHILTVFEGHRSVKEREIESDE